MSLILGLHLLERIYLVSDTRLSYLDGKEPEDNFIKVFKLNNSISAVAAGSAHPASFILNRLREGINEKSTISDLNTLIKLKLIGFINDYVNTTGNHSGNVALVIGGFNHEKGKRIEASRLGKAMSTMVIPAQGKQVNQSFDKRLIESFVQLSGKGKGDYITVHNVRTADLLSVTFDVRTATISDVKSTECYDYIIFHPNQTIKQVQIPDEIVSLLEFRDRAGKSIENILYEEAEILINCVRRILRENNFSSVGGHIYPLLQLPELASFPTGDIATINDGQIVRLGSFYVEEGVQMYELENGTRGRYRHLEELTRKYARESNIEEMLI